MAVDDLELQFVDVDRVGVGGEVGDLPDLGSAEGGVLGDRVVPAGRDGFAARVERAEERRRGSDVGEDVGVGLVE